jgi:hypothetical protein
MIPLIASTIQQSIKMRVLNDSKGLIVRENFSCECVYNLVTIIFLF